MPRGITVQLPDDWDLGSVVEAAKPGNLFPSGVGFNAARVDKNRYVRAVNALVRRGFDVRPVEISRAPKADRSTRPAADMPVTDQLIYEALIGVLKARLYPGLMTFTGGETDPEYTQFEDFPLGIANTTHVLTADVAAFFEYIDHDRLAYELIGATGESDLVASLIDLLDAWMQGPRALPQGPTASWPLADIYISPVDRSLRRGGFQFSRYSDDFRVATGSWSAARTAQLGLETALREVGLSIAPGKLRTPRIDTYRAQVEAIRNERETNPLGWTGEAGEAPGYGDKEPVAIVVTDVEARRAEQILQQVIASEKPTPGDPRRLRWALPRLAYANSQAGLEHVDTLLFRYAQLTPVLAGYLRILTLSGLEEQSLNAAVDWLSASTFRYPWQVGWMFHAVSFSPRNLNRRLATLAKAALGDAALPWFVRGQAAIALSVVGKLPTQTEYVGVYELSPDSTRPDLIAAVLVAAPSWGSAFLAGVVSSPLERATTRLDPGNYREWLR